MHRIVRCLAIASCLAAPGRVASQDMSGQAIEDSTRRPLVKLQVVLWRIAGQSLLFVDSARTDERGLFQINARGPGRYQLRFGTWNAPFARGPVDSLASYDTVVQRSYRIEVLRLSARRPFDLTQVDEVALPLNGRVIAKYPDEMHKQCVDGDVMSSVVVDGDGKPEMTTFRVESATSEDFIDAVRTAFAATRFSSAEIGGIPVRQLVTSPVQFRADCKK